MKSPIPQATLELIATATYEKHDKGKTGEATPAALLAQELIEARARITELELRLAKGMR